MPKKRRSTRATTKKKPAAKKPGAVGKTAGRARKPAGGKGPRASGGGRFVWYELLTTDVDGARRFYPQVTGWGAAPYEKDPSYIQWTNAGVPLAGLMSLPEASRRSGTPPCWMAYVSTADVDATAKQAAALGGKVLAAPGDIPQVGRFAVIQDPQGAALAVFRPFGSPSRETHLPGFGDFSWHELATTDQEAAFRFYHALFGWEKTEAHDMGEMGIYQLFGQEGATYGGMFTKTPDMPGPPAWIYYVRVESAERAAEKVKASGGNVLHGPMEVPAGDRIAQCMDPQGAVFAVHWKKGRAI